MPFVFFGTPELSADILEYLKKRGLVPSLIVTNPDRPAGRGLVPASSPVKLWALKNKIPRLQPEYLLDPDFIYTLKAAKCNLFIVVAYGKIIPREILAIPSKGSLNIHYSLLPKYRGASPVESAILADDRDVGVSIILLDEKMDHGPIVAEEKVIAPHWPPSAPELRKWCNETGARLLADTIPLWLEGKILAREQDHDKATYAEKISKEDGLLDLTDSQYKNFLKIQAYKIWPRAYFFAAVKGKKIRVTVADAKWENGQLAITRVIPEGKREVSYQDFQKQLRNQPPRPGRGTAENDK